MATPTLAVCTPAGSNTGAAAIGAEITRTAVPVAAQFAASTTPVTAYTPTSAGTVGEPLYVNATGAPEPETAVAALGAPV